MKLDDLFYGMSAMTGFLGLGGLGGYCDMGTGLIPSILFLIVCALCAGIGTYFRGGAKDE